jgi:hypothetical protein
VSVNSKMESELEYTDTENFTDRYAAELICGNCKKLENGAEECRHNLELIPPWKDPQTLEVVKLIFGDKVSTMKRESLYFLPPLPTPRSLPRRFTVF